MWEITCRGSLNDVFFILWESVIVLCFVVCYVHSSIAIILMGKRELVALLNLSSWCLVKVERLFLVVPQGCLQFVIVVFPDHTHSLFFILFCFSESPLPPIKYYDKMNLPPPVVALPLPSSVSQNTVNPEIFARILFS